MWLVSKNHDGTESTRDRVPADTLAALTRWYVGEGTDADERHGVRLVQRARIHDRWLACGCLGEAAQPPLLSPAYLTQAETYYLRRLTGDGRPEHRSDCPFFRDQAAYRQLLTDVVSRPLERPDGFFSVLKPVPEHLSQRPEDDADNDRARGPSVPRLARLLWGLMDRASTNIIPNAGSARSASISSAFGALRLAAESFQIAPGQRLDRMLFTHPRDLLSRRAYAELRRVKQQWPEGHEPQAFMLLYTREIRGQELHFSEGEPILVSGTVQRPAGKNVDRGPYLAIVAVGEHPDAKGYLPLRAYGQPVLSGRHFIPVDSNFERHVVRACLAAQRTLADRGIAATLRKPVFDIETPHGHCRPDVILDIADGATGAVAAIVVEAMGFRDEVYLAAKQRTHPRMAAIGPVVAVTPDDLDDGEELAHHLARVAEAQL